MISSLFPLLQLCDSNFPSGAFSHSFGLETYIQDQQILDKESFLKAIGTYISHQLVYCDGLACRFIFEALENQHISEIIKYDQLLFVSSLANETRTGNRRIGVRLAKLCAQLYPSEHLTNYLNQINRKEAYGHSSLVFAMVSFHLQVEKDTALGAYLFSCVSSLIQNAVRGIPLGQTDGQKLLVEVQLLIKGAVAAINLLNPEDFGAASPGLEIAQMRHERLDVRLFMS
ncbi:urease accessory protein UreF [Bacillus sp. 1NLA3E]|uniref:urease accessory protein UreF n=1 Tax=Bacillus sp. 1NLA3E TaxID=666686 RepID=UPI000247EAB5|nr:urease accessory protein UreF [Bacillus sp. 1NLA3E]